MKFYQLVSGSGVSSIYECKSSCTDLYLRQDGSLYECYNACPTTNYFFEKESGAHPAGKYVCDSACSNTSTKVLITNQGYYCNNACTCSTGMNAVGGGTCADMLFYNENQTLTYGTGNWTVCTANCAADKYVHTGSNTDADGLANTPHACVNDCIEPYGGITKEMVRIDLDTNYFNASLLARNICRCHCDDTTKSGYRAYDNGKALVCTTGTCSSHGGYYFCYTSKSIDVCSARCPYNNLDILGTTVPLYFPFSTNKINGWECGQVCDSNSLIKKDETAGTTAEQYHCVLNCNDSAGYVFEPITVKKGINSRSAPTVNENRNLCKKTCDKDFLMITDYGKLCTDDCTCPTNSTTLVDVSNSSCSDMKFSIRNMNLELYSGYFESRNQCLSACPSTSPMATKIDSIGIYSCETSCLNFGDKKFYRTGITITNHTPTVSSSYILCLDECQSSPIPGGSYLFAYQMSLGYQCIDDCNSLGGHDFYYIRKEENDARFCITKCPKNVCKNASCTQNEDLIYYEVDANATGKTVNQICLPDCSGEQYVEEMPNPTDTDKRYYCQDNCPSGKRFYKPDNSLGTNGRFICWSSCPNSADFVEVENAAHGAYCRPSCTTHHVGVNPLPRSRTKNSFDFFAKETVESVTNRKRCYTHCNDSTSYKLYYYQNDGSQECVSACPTSSPDYAYLDKKTSPSPIHYECLIACPTGRKYYYLFTEETNPSNRLFHCDSDCSQNNESYVKKLTDANSQESYKCLATCTNYGATYIYFWDEPGINRHTCHANCTASTYTFVDKNADSLYECLNLCRSGKGYYYTFNLISTYKECFTTCPSPQIFYLEDSDNRFECQFFCPFASNYYFELDGATNTSTLRYKCVANCQATDLFVQEYFGAEVLADYPTGSSIKTDYSGNGAYDEARRVGFRCRTDCPTGFNYVFENVDSHYICETNCLNSTREFNDHAIVKNTHAASAVMHVWQYDATVGTVSYPLCRLQCESTADTSLYIEDNSTSLRTCASSCIDDKPFMFRNYVASVYTNKVCIQSCTGTAQNYTTLDGVYTDANPQFALPDERGYCEETCDSGDPATSRIFVILEKNDSFDLHYCLAECPISKQYLFSIGDAEGHYECIAECPVYYFGETLICEEHCYGIYLHPNKACFDQCNFPNVFAVQPPGWNATSDPLNCRSECYDNTYYYYAEPKFNRCVPICEQIDFVVPHTNALTLTETGECLTSCAASNFVLVQADSRDSSFQRKFCFAVCPVPFFHTFKNNYQECKNECYEDENYIITSNRYCVSSCQSNAFENFKYYNEQLECINECSNYIDLGVACVEICPSDRKFNQDGHCIEACTAEKPYYNDNFTCLERCPTFFIGFKCYDVCPAEAPYIRTDNTCSIKCDEKNARVVNSVTKECSRFCPICDDPDIVGCEHLDLQFLDPTNFCRDSCPIEFKYVDSSDSSCHARCPESKPFYTETNYSCSSKCPKDKNYIIKGEICIEKCSPEFPLLHIDKLTEFNYCLTECYEYYEYDIGKGICVLNCDIEKGLLPTADGTTCIQLASENKNKVIQGHELKDSCDFGFSPDENRYCRSCFEQDKWTNGNGTCIDNGECPENGFIDNNTKVCYECKGGNLMIFKSKCQQTDCAGGVVEIVKDTKYCYVCDGGTFYYNQTCIDECPDNTKIDLFSNRCINECEDTNSDDCCVNNGVPNKSGNKIICTCSQTYTGYSCQAPIIEIDKIEYKHKEYIRKKLEKIKPLNSGDLILLVEYAESMKTRKMQADPSLVTQLKTYIDRKEVEYSTQPEIFYALDGIFSILLNITERRILSVSDIPYYYNYLENKIDEIQLFNVGKSEIAATFERIFAFNYIGFNFRIRFGTTVLEQEEVNFTKCIEKINTVENFPPKKEYPYKISTYSLDLSIHVFKHKPTSFMIKANPLIQTSLYQNSGLALQVNDYCNLQTIDYSFNVDLDEGNSSKLAEFEKQGIDLLDSQADFFMNKCVPFSQDGKDLTIAERQKLIIDPREICGASSNQQCTLSKDAFRKIKCDCKYLIGGSKNTGESQVPSTNYILVTCYDTFSNASLFENIGFYIVLIPTLIFTCYAFYSAGRMRKIIGSPRLFECIRNDCEFFDPSCMEKDIFFDECINLGTFYLEVELGNNDDIPEEIENEESLRMNKLFKEIRQNYVKKANCMPTFLDYDKLTIEECVIYDKRSNWEYAKDIMTREHDILSLLFMESIMEPKIYRVLFLMTEINLNTMLNAFFIDDSLIESSNQSEENAGDPLETLRQEVIKTIWAVLAKKVVMTLFEILFVISADTKNKMYRRLETGYNGYIQRAYDKFMTKQRVMMIFLVFTLILFNVLCSYFVIIFVEIYRSSIDIWINGILMGFIIDYLIMQVFFPLLDILSRALIMKFNCFFFLNKISKISKLIETALP